MWTIRDFQPVNQWSFDRETDIYQKCHTQHDDHVHIVDQSTEERYLNEPENMIRFKCVLLAFGTTYLHPVAGMMNIAYRVLKLVTLSHFWMPHRQKGLKYLFKMRLSNAGKDLLRIAMQPLAIVGLLLASVYGVVSPYDGRKLYASIERATYGSVILAPSFQPHEIGILSYDEFLAKRLHDTLNA